MVAAGAGVVMVAAVGGIALATDSGSVPSGYTSLAPTVVGQYSLALNGNKEVPIAGVDGVPSSATSVQLSVTALNESATGALYLYASGTTQPGSANMRWNAGVVTTVPITTAVGSNGQIHLHNTTGTTQIKVSVIGYYTPDLGPTAVGRVATSKFLTNTAANIAAITVVAGTYSVIAKLNLQNNVASADAVSCVVYGPELETIDSGGQSLAASTSDVEMMTMSGLVTMDSDGQIAISCSDSTSNAEAYEIHLTAIHLGSASGDVTVD
jgi:hypothetical protein